MGVKYLEPLQIGELLATVANRKGPVGQRDTCITRLLWESGLRVNECLSLTPADINLKTQEIKVRFGKGNKSRTVPWRNERTTNLLKQWLEVRPDDSEWLFPVIRSPGRRETGESTKGNKLHPNSFRASLKRYIKLAGLPEWASCHTCRHSYAIYMLEQGVPLPALQRLLGHSRLSTTGMYLEVRDKDAIERAKNIKDDF